MVNEKNLVLYHYWRSSASWRLRWALELKKLKPQMVLVNLLNDEAESPEHKSRNPFGYVPVLHIGERTLVESVAIMELLDEIVPENALFWGDPFERAHIRSLVEFINAGTQPLINLPVLDYLSPLQETQQSWCQNFLRRGLTAYQEQIRGSYGQYSFGHRLSAADLCLIPQLYSANRWGINVEKEFPLLKGIYDKCLETKEAYASRPEAYEPKQA